MTSDTARTPVILLFGRNGQVGWELERVLATRGRLISLERSGADGLTGDLTDADGLRETIRRIRPDVIFNAAAYTAVDKAESEPELARLINAGALGVIGEEAKRCGALVVHFSTDYVFNGEGDTPYREDDSTSLGPLNTYGQSKLEGEEALRATGARHLIFRTSWVYGVHGKNFMKTVLRLAKSREHLSMVSDQTGAPTSADFIADTAAALALRALAGEPLEGTWHLVPDGTTTWYSFSRWILENAASDKSFLLMPDQISPITSQEYPTPAKRPLNSRLDNTKLAAALPEGAIRPWEYYALRTLNILTEKI